ncbi:MAG: hypothetical protein HYW48_11950 [Deltaproteobacteria bacterium]|nr:hypothetical protein [Deltaproteobacteria bacterium]
MKKILMMLTSLSISLSSDLALAKMIYYGSETETLTIAYGAATLLRFDEEVKTISQASKFIIEPADQNDPNYRLLSIKARVPEGKDSVSFILANDTVVNLQVVTVPSHVPEKKDSFYDLKAKELSIDPAKDSVQGSDVSELELMKAMIRSDKIIGYEAKAIIRSVDTGVEGITAKLVKVYTGPKFNGYIFKVSNVSSSMSYAVDLKSLTLGRPNTALLSQVDTKILAPHGSEGGRDSSTFLRIVAKSSSVYYTVTLPVAPIQQK